MAISLNKKAEKLRKRMLDYLRMLDYVANHQRVIVHVLSIGVDYAELDVSVVFKEDREPFRLPPIRVPVGKCIIVPDPTDFGIL